MSDSGIDQVMRLAMSCALACLTGSPTVTVCARGKRLAGFPRGELLSVGADGSRNYAVDPVKVLAWIRTNAPYPSGSDQAAALVKSR